jgi:hypothetical protein
LYGRRGEEGRGESQSQRQLMMDNTPQLVIVIEISQHCRATKRNEEEKRGKRRCRFNTNTPRK